MSAMMWKNWITYTLLVRMWSDTSILENCLIASYKTKYEITMWSRKCTLGHLSQRNENLYSYKIYTWMFREALFIAAFLQKLKIAQISFNRRTVKQTSTSITWNVLVIKKNELLAHTSTWMNLQGIILSKKSQRLHTVWFHYRNGEQIR